MPSTDDPMLGDELGQYFFYDKWDERFMRIAREHALWSKDPSARIGAVAVDPERRYELCHGYNGFPAGTSDRRELYDDRIEKHRRVIHAEMNVVAKAAYLGISLDGATLYVYGLPVCDRCAPVLIQVGIRRVVQYFDFNTLPDRWLESAGYSELLFEEAGVTLDGVSLGP